MLSSLNKLQHEVLLCEFVIILMAVFFLILFGKLTLTLTFLYAQQNFTFLL